MKRTLIPIFLLLISVTISYSQKPPIKFGEVSLDELKMTSSYLDSTAPAVVLCDYGYFRMANVNFTRIMRIKILKKEGYSWANQSFQSDFKSSLRGITTNLENGKIVQEKLKNESIFQTRVFEDYYILRPAMPDVKVGSVIDLEFTFHGIPGEWRFQEEIPVVQSELVLEDRPGIVFRTNFFGYEHLTYSTSNRWIARDMPAFKEEPYMSSIENYITKIKLDIASSYSQTWLKINELLYESSYFGMNGVNYSFLNDISNKLSKKYTNKEDLLRAAYDTIRQTIVWNESKRLGTEDGNLTSVFRLKVGNSAEINMILYKLLKKLDFDATPVVLSTRDNGTLSIYNPSLRQLNYVIVYVKKGEKEYFLDATEKYMPLNLLPLRCLNVQGRYIDKNIDLWLNVSNNKKSKDLVIYDLKLDADLNMKGNISHFRSDYAAFDFRKKYFAFNSRNEYIESYNKENPDIIIKDIKFENLDSVYKPVSENQTVEIRNQVNEIDNNYYIIPSSFGVLKENPFKLDSRKYPVDFGIPTDKTIMLNLTIPEGFTPVTIPPSITLKLPENSMVFKYEAVRVENQIRLTGKFMINKILYLPDEYSDLQEFFNQILKKQSEPIILKKL